MKLLVEQRILEDMVEDILLEHVFGPTDGQISEADAVSLPGTKDKSLSGRARDMLRRRFGGRGKGLSPMGDAPESKPGFLDKIAQKLGLSRDFEKMLLQKLQVQTSHWISDKSTIHEKIGTHCTAAWKRGNSRNHLA